MTVRVVDRDKGFRKILADARRLNRSHAVVGIRQEKGNAPAKDGDPSGITVAEVATIHEFGAPAAHIPARPFLRDAFDRNYADYRAILVHALGQVIDGKYTVRKAVSLVAIRAVGDVQEGIATPGRFVANAPMTIALKGSSQPLIDTGRLRQSIDYEVRTGRDADGEG